MKNITITLGKDLWISLITTNDVKIKRTRRGKLKSITGDESVNEFLRYLDVDRVVYITAEEFVPQEPVKEGKQSGAKAD